MKKETVINDVEWHKNELLYNNEILQFLTEEQD